jgi:hypothetical protein
MPKTGSTPERLIGLLRQAEVEPAQGRTAGEVCHGRGCRSHPVSLAGGAWPRCGGCRVRGPERAGACPGL